MSMVFQTIRDAIIEVLGDDADIGSGPRYRVIGYQSQGSAASEFKDNGRAVVVYYYRGQFPKGKGTIAGPNDHDMSFRIESRASGKAVGNVSDPANIDPASFDADRAIDDLLADVYQVLMNPKNEFMGLAKGIVQSRWVAEYQKDDPGERGEYTFITGSLILTCTTKEAVTTQAGIPGEEYQTTVDIDGDDTEKTATAGTLGGS